MKKNLFKLLILPLILGTVVVTSGCTTTKPIQSDIQRPENSSSEIISSEQSQEPSSEESSSEATSSEEKEVDYASDLKLDLNSGRATSEATVKLHIDGDTVHFNTPDGVGIENVLKARFLGVDTPESTGKVQPWGKTASNYTKEKLAQEGVQIILESNSDKWEADSTGERFLVYVWYKTPEMSDYKCLNLELMQEGLAYQKGSSDLIYKDSFTGAFNKAYNGKLKVYSDEQDPNYYYGAYVETTVKGLKTFPEEYDNTLVRFEGIVSKISNNTAYVVDLDEATDVTYGVQVYYGFDSAVESNCMKVGYKLSVCGTYQYYAAGDVYQVSGLNYYAMKPTHEKGTWILEKGLEIEPVKVTGADMNSNQPNDLYEGLSKLEAMLHSYVSCDNLYVKSAYTTKKGSNTGAMTLTCTDPSGKTVKVRTGVIYKDSTNKLCEADVLNKTISVVGIVDKYVLEESDQVSPNDYQIKVFGLADILIK